MSCSSEYLKEGRNTLVHFAEPHVMFCLQVLDDELCYKYSEYHNIFEVFSTRARMFRSVYLHK